MTKLMPAHSHHYCIWSFANVPGIHSFDATPSTIPASHMILDRLWKDVRDRIDLRAHARASIEIQSCADVLPIYREWSQLDSTSCRQTVSLQIQNSLFGALWQQAQDCSGYVHLCPCQNFPVQIQEGIARHHQKSSLKTLSTCLQHA